MKTAVKTPNPLFNAALSITEGKEPDNTELVNDGESPAIHKEYFHDADITICWSVDKENAPKYPEYALIGNKYIPEYLPKGEFVSWPEINRV